MQINYLFGVIIIYFYFSLWCICRTPHNNRFMICCDKCEEWFHGKCVGVTRQMGRDMEDRQTDWMCPNCVKKQQPSIKVSNITLYILRHNLLISFQYPQEYFPAKNNLKQPTDYNKRSWTFIIDSDTIISYSKLHSVWH